MAGLWLALVAAACGGTPALEPSGGSGRLAIGIQGLDSGATALVGISGPGGYRHQVSRSTTLSGLLPGTYSVIATTVKAKSGVFVPVPSGQVGTVSPGSTTGLVVSYLSPWDTSGLNLRIDGLYLTQAVQRYDGTVPLVAGRKAFLRVFAVGNRASPLKPRVRVRLYQGGQLLRAFDVPAPSEGIAAEVGESDLGTSWNLMIPGRYILPGLQVQADIDAENAIAERDETDNYFPSGETARAVMVRPVPSLDIRFVPVITQANGKTGNITPENAEQFLADLKVLAPIGPYSFEVRTPYLTSARPLLGNNANGAWSAILSELLALRTADRSSRHYYGVVKAPYSEGTAGIAYIGGDRPVALGWDHLPSASYVMAHELAHNFGRSHAPCGASSPDRSYPYAQGRIGVWGFDPTWLTLKNPAKWTDLTGYCNPYWVSDYTWEAMLAFRAGRPTAAPALPPAPASGSSLLVWGRITPDGPVLEPGFWLDAAGALPESGPYRLGAFAADGSRLFSVPFAAVPVADLPSGPEEAFAFVLPAGAALDRIAELRVEARGRSAVRRGGGTARPSFHLAPESAAGAGRLSWDPERHPMVMVRDPVTGEVLSFARGGSLVLPPAPNGLELHFSDGVRSQLLRR